MIQRTGRRSLSILLLAAAAAPLVFYISAQLRSVDLPCYMDVLYTLGAGSRLAVDGHFSSTFMLYGLLNPFLTEGLIRMGAGAHSFILSRQFQSIWAILAIWGVSGSVRAMVGGKSKPAILLCGTSLLASVVTTIELLDARPECPTIAVLSLLLWRSVAYSGRMRETIMLGLLTGLLVGARPSNISMIFISPLVIVMKTPRALERRKNLLAWSVFALMSVLLLFPHYILHAQHLLEQFRTYYLNAFPPADNMRLVVGNLLLAAFFLLFTLPGPLHSAGVMLFVACSFRNRIDRGLTCFTAGIVPFIIGSIRSAEFQSRHLSVLAPMLAVISCLGLLHLWARNRTVASVVVIAMGTILSMQFSKMWDSKFSGGLARILDEAAEMSPSVFLGEGGSFSDEAYGREIDSSWPLVICLGSESWIDSPGTGPVLLITDEPMMTRPGWRLLSTSGIESNLHDLVRNQGNPVIMNMLAYFREPWLWRDWGPVSLYCALQ